MKIDGDKFRALIRAEARRLDSIPLLGTDADWVTEGRVSGLYLALSFLKECEIKE